MNTLMTQLLRQRFMKSLAALSILITLGIASPAWAISLDAAKDKGLVGELTNGYLGYVQANPNNEVKQLITDINNKRKAVYIKKAKAAGVSLQIMEREVGERLIERAEKGHYVSDGSGHWQKK